MANANDRTILDVSGLNVYFETSDGPVQAIRDVSFGMHAGQIIGLVGESGSGKSVTGMAMMGLLPSSATVEGSIMLGDRELVGLTESQMTPLRGGEIAMVFQDSLSALDPVQKVGWQVADTVRAHNGCSKREAWERAGELLDQVGIPDPRARLSEYPHQLSGGMRQRVMIAVALAGDPALLIADEPTTALDVTIQAQILDLLRAVCEERETALLFITHDLGVVAELCSEVVTMYAGEVVENAAIDDLLTRPRHPYSSGLLRSIPVTSAGERRMRSIPGRVPSLHDMPVGCRFQDRCEFASAICRDEHPQLFALDELGRAQARCHHALDLELAGAVARS